MNTAHRHLFSWSLLMVAVQVATGCQRQDPPRPLAGDDRGRPVTTRAASGRPSAEEVRLALKRCMEANEGRRPMKDTVRFLHQLPFYRCAEQACRSAEPSRNPECGTFHAEMERERESLVNLYGLTCPEEIPQWREDAPSSEVLERSYSEALACLSEHCEDEDDADVCRMASRLHRSFGDTAKADALEKRVVSLQEARRNRWKGGAEEMRAQMKETMDRLNRRAEEACDEGHANSCARLAQVEQEAGALDDALEYAERACELDRRWKSTSGGCMLVERWRAAPAR